jgi:hypothetical protein
MAVLSITLLKVIELKFNLSYFFNKFLVGAEFRYWLTELKMAGLI